MRRYSTEEMRYIISLAEKIGASEAARICSVPVNTINSWLFYARRAKKNDAEKYTVEQKYEIVRYAQEYGTHAASQDHGISEYTLSKWRREFENGDHHGYRVVKRKRLGFYLNRNVFKRRLKKLGIKQKDLAAMVGRDVMTISAYANGSRSMKPAIAEKIAAILQVEFKDLVSK
jgi:transposase-like protein